MKKLYLILSIALISIPVVIGIRSVEASLVSVSTLDNGLVAYWNLDEATTTGLMRDSSGYGNNLIASTTIVGAVKAQATTSKPSQIKFPDAGSLFFTGNSTTGQMLIGSTSPSLLVSQGLTISMWYRATSTISSGATQQTLLSYTGSNGSDRYGYGLYMSPVTIGNTGAVALLLGGGAGAGGWNTYPSTRVSWTGGTWYHIVVMTDNKTYRTYVDGVLNSSGVSASIMNGFQTQGIYMCGVSSLYCSGTIDDVRIYNRALNSYEVTALYNNSAVQFKPTTIGHSSTNTLMSGLTGYWTFDGNSINYLVATPLFADASGNNSTGTASFTTGRATMLSPGRTGSAIKLNGTGQYITLGASSRYIAASSSPTSVSLWFNAKSLAADANMPNRLFSILKSPSESAIILNLKDSKKVEYFDGTTIWTLPLPISLNSWYHLAFVYDGTKGQVYLNGVANGTSTTYVLGKGSSDLARLGADATGARLFDGSLDSVRVYNRALSLSEIQYLYNSEQVITSHTATNMLTSGLIGHWSFDANTANYALTSPTFRDNVSNIIATSTGLTKTTMLAPGRTGSALKFNGTNNQLSLPTSTSATGKSEYSVSLWAYNVDQSTRMFYDDSTTGGFFRFTITNTRESANKIGVSFRNTTTGDAGTRIVIFSNTNTQLNTWSHIVATYSVANSRARLFVNGVQVAATTTDITAFSTTTTQSSGVLIGAASGITTYFNGNMDNLRMYNRELSTQEINQLYLSGM